MARRPWSSRLYAAALRLYSPAFRRRFGSGMTQAFEWRMTNAQARGRLPVVAVAAATAADLLVTAAGDRLAQAGAIRGVAQDLRVSARRMRRQPMDTMLAVGTLAIGIGSVTAIFAIAHAILIAPLPFPGADRIVAVRAAIDGRPVGISYENARDLDVAATAFDALTPFAAQSVNLTAVPEPDRVRGGFVSREFFDVVGVRPAMGEAWSAASDTSGGPPAAVISHAVWQTRFGGTPDVLSRSMVLNNVTFAIVGVMPRDFDFPLDETEVWLPIVRYTGALTRGSHSYVAIGRLTAGVSTQVAAAEVSAVGRDLAGTHATNRGLALTIEPFHAALTRETRAPLGLLLAMVSVLLLAACVNVAGFRVGATIGRGRELATRSALGAGRARLAAQVVGESMITGLLGALLGLVVAMVALRLLVTTSGLPVYGLERVGLNVPVAVFAVLAGLASGVLAGLLPALHWARTPGRTGPAGDTRVTTGGGKMRSVLVAAQIALAVVTLVSAGLLIRSYVRLASIDPGFTSENVLTLEYRLPRNKYQTPAAQAAFHEQALARVRAVPGVVAASSVRALPFSGNGSRVSYGVTPDARSIESARFNTVADGYFQTLGIPVLAGRTFDSRERPGSPPAVIVSAAFARRHWPSQDPLGRRVYFSSPAIAAEIVGVVADIRHEALSDEGLEAIYASNAQNPGIFMTMAVRTAGEPMAMAGDVRAAVWSLDPDQPMWKVRSLESLITASLGRDRFLLRALSFFAASALLLALLATYGSVTQAVALRRREIGLRVALGARPVAVLALVMRGTMTVCIAGVLAGVGASLVVAPALAAFLHGVEPTDAGTFAAACALLLLASMLASWLPARRALEVDPAVTLREA